MDMSYSGTPEQKLKWAFRIFDKDHSGLYGISSFKYFLLSSGSIDLREMTKVMGCLLELEGIGRVGQYGVKYN